MSDPIPVRYGQILRLEHDLARRDRRSRWQRLRCAVTAHYGIPYIQAYSGRKWSCCGRRVIRTDV